MRFRRYVTIALVLCAVLASALVPGAATSTALAAAPVTEPIRVALGDRVAQATIGVDQEYEIINVASGGVIASGSGYEPVTVSATGQGIRVGDYGVFTGPVVFRMAGGGFANTSRYNGRVYRGQIEVRLSGGSLTIVNVLPLEQYLLAVVPKEMPASWHPEALKAQAVASRSYAAYQMRSLSRDGYHVYDSINSQVYGGVAAEDPRTTAAVQATAGEVLLHNGSVIVAFFHAAAGGYTEDSENVWGSYVPYIRAVPDFDSASSHNGWVHTMTRAEIQAKLDQAGYSIGTFRRIEPDGPRSISGRWTRLAVVGDAGRVSVRANDLRLQLGLKSTLFELTMDGVPMGGSLPPVRKQWSRTGTAGAAAAAAGIAQLLPHGAAVAGSIVPTGLPHTPAPQAPAPALPASAQTFTFTGSGWGHGTGMSQWGARGLAEMGYGYEYILAHYYQGTNLSRMEVAAR